MDIKNNIIIRQFLLFTGIGAVGTAGHYLVLISLVQTDTMPPVYATTCGFVIGAIINYILNYKITFKSNKNHSEALLKFMTVALLGAAINTSLMYFGTKHVDVHYLWIQITATGLILIFSFTFNRLWTFAHSQLHQNSIS